MAQPGRRGLGEADDVPRPPRLTHFRKPVEGIAIDLTVAASNTAARGRPFRLALLAEGAECDGIGSRLRSAAAAECRNTPHWHRAIDRYFAVADHDRLNFRTIRRRDASRRVDRRMGYGVGRVEPQDDTSTQLRGFGDVRNHDTAGRLL